MFTTWEIAGLALAPCASIVFVWIGVREVPKLAAVCVITGAAMGYAAD